MKKVVIIMLVCISLVVSAEKKISQKILLVKNISDGQIAKYWERLQIKGEKMLKGIDVQLEVHTEYTEEEELTGGVTVKVPFFSKIEKQKKKENQAMFLEKGSTIIRNLEINRRKLRVKKKKRDMLESIMLEEGVKGIDAYHNAVEQIIVIETDINDLIRKIEILLL